MSVRKATFLLESEKNDQIVDFYLMPKITELTSSLRFIVLGKIGGLSRRKVLGGPKQIVRILVLEFCNCHSKSPLYVPSETFYITCSLRCPYFAAKLEFIERKTERKSQENQR